jgi:hypothetical protein
MAFHANVDPGGWRAPDGFFPAMPAHNLFPANPEGLLAPQVLFYFHHGIIPLGRGGCLCL